MCKTRCAIPASMVLLACSYGQTVVWAPDYVGQQVQVRSGEDPGTKSVTLQLTQCNPNSVAVNGGRLYIICSGATNGDKVLVYDAAAIKGAAPGSLLADQPLQIITSAEFSELIGVAFDAQNNLWVASNGNGKILSISEAALKSANPAVTVSLVDSPASPVGLAFDPDGSLWVTGLFGGGILLNIPADQLNKGAGAQARFCMASQVLDGCQQQDNLFKNPEGVALFDGKIWVANNSTGDDGATPGRELVGLAVSNGVLVVSTVFGSSQDNTGPFVCPGGLLATSQYLWVNDESFGEINSGCGAKGDTGSGVGGIFRFTKQLLADKSADTGKILRFSNITGRPGFGGLFVEEDNPGGMAITITVLAGSSIAIGAQAPLAFGGVGSWSLGAMVSDDGTLRLPANQMRFPPIPIMAAGATFNVQLVPTQDGFGSINPNSGDFSATLSMRLHISSALPFFPAAGCRIPETTLALDVRNAGGIPYSPVTGAATLVDTTFAVPASTGCGIFGNIIDAQLSLPSASGRNVFKINVSLDPIVVLGN